MGDSETKADRQTIDLYYKKTRNHRTVVIDGAWAGVTPQLELQLALFKTVQPMPDYTTHAIVAEGGLGPEISRVAQKGLVREVEVTAIIDANVVESIIELLQQFRDKIKSIQAVTEAHAAEVSEKSTEG